MAIVVLLIIALVLVIALMSVTLITWPLLSGEKRADFRDLVDRFLDWIKIIMGGSPPPPAA